MYWIKIDHKINRYIELPSEFVSITLASLDSINPSIQMLRLSYLSYLSRWHPLDA